MRPEPDRVHRHEPGGPPGGIESAERSHHDREADPKREQPGGNISCTPPEMNWLAIAMPAQAMHAADESREQPEIGALERHQGQDVPLRPAVGPQDAELDEPLGGAHQHRVDDPDHPDEQGQADGHQQERIDLAHQRAEVGHELVHAPGVDPGIGLLDRRASASLSRGRRLDSRSSRPCPSADSHDLRAVSMSMTMTTSRSIDPVS